MRHLIPVIALATLALGAAPGGAATVTSTRSALSYPGGKGVPDIDDRHAHAHRDRPRPGEPNAVTVSASGGLLTVHDGGAPPVAGRRLRRGLWRTWPARSGMPARSRSCSRSGTATTAPRCRSRPRA